MILRDEKATTTITNYYYTPCCKQSIQQLCSILDECEKEGKCSQKSNKSSDYYT